MSDQDPQLEQGPLERTYFDQDDQRMVADLAYTLGLRSFENFLLQHDETTGLLRKDVWKNRVSGAVETALEGGNKHIGVVFIDLTNFKEVNDRHDHLVGDEVLKGAANQLTESLRTDSGKASDQVGFERIAGTEEGYHVSRYGGDEFAILLDLSARAEVDQKRWTDEERLQKVIDRITDHTSAFSEAVRGLLAKGFDIAVGGAVWDPSIMKSADDLIRRADQNMAEQKYQQHKELGAYRESE